MTQIYIDGKPVQKMPKFEEGRWYHIVTVTKPNHLRTTDLAVAEKDR